MVIQAIVGIFLFEWSYRRVAGFKQVDPAREEYFKAYARLDAPRWARWKFYPGAAFTLPTRAILLIMMIVTLFFSISILCIGHNFDKGPMPDGCRKKVIRMIYKACAGFGLFIGGMTTTVTYQDVDYSYYLGDGYKDKYKDIAKTSTIVCNHVSWLDPFVMVHVMMPAFTPTIGYKNVPLFGTICSVLDSIFVDRGADEATKERIINTIQER